jgi:alpha-L-rhamnosidase
MKSRAGDDLVWTGDFHFGDWLAYSTTHPDYPGATTGTDAIATAFFAHSTGLLARIARILDRPHQAQEYERLTTNVKRAFVKEFVTETGRVAENTQTAYALALMFDLLPEELRAPAAERLATTGFLGTPYLNDVLTRFGYLDIAYDLLLRKDYPSWLYPVTRGATTIWERWDGQKPDGTFQSPTMNSFNHYAYGAVGDWIYRVVAGIDTDADRPGYKHVLIRPQPGGGLTSASASLETMYGTVSSKWSLDGDRFRLQVGIPANTSATIRIPGTRTSEIAGAPGITKVREETDAIVIEAGSGKYDFQTTWN